MGAGLSLLLGLILIFPGCAGKDPIPIKTGEEVTLEQSSFSFSNGDFRIFSEYRIAPGDQLDVLFSIQSWQKEVEFHLNLGDTVTIKFVTNPELNETQKIRPDGNISLPYLGEVQVAGRSVRVVEKELTERYSKIFRKPEIYVLVPEYLSQIRELKVDLHTASRGLSRLVTVRPDGFTTFPMVGDVLVGDKTIEEVGSHLNAQYAKISPSLKVDLFLERHAGSPIYVLGQVARPGAFPILKPATVAEAMALAGGSLVNARLDSIIVVRKHQKKVVGTRVNLEQTLTLGPGAGHFFLQPDDIVYVPNMPISETSDIIRRVADVFQFRGWNLGMGWTWDNVPAKNRLGL
ncbi:MAG: polysaccharide biosynthesis/export family protein [Magnetococcales bacterium]|nr:polysaccharide biosynthesis/export family protein [Magnetococcales bacterium]